MPYKSREDRLAYNRTYHKDYYATNREKVLRRTRAYNENHRDEKRAWQRGYDAQRKNGPSREARLEYQRTYMVQKRKDKPEECREISKAAWKKRRATKLSAPRNDFTRQQWEAMKAQYDYRCVYCGKKSKRLTQDHITPLSKGGSHTLANIVPACGSCNSKKHTGPPLKAVQPMLL